MHSTRHNAHDPSRRLFLRRTVETAAAGLAAAAAVSGFLVNEGCVPPGSATRRSPRIRPVDAHTHFYDPGRPQGVPWPPKDDPLLYRAVLPPEWHRLAGPLDIQETIVVEASPWEEDNQWVLDLAARESGIVGLVGHLKPGKPGFEAYLKRFATHRLFRGIRTGGWDGPITPSASPFVEDLRRVADRGLALDVLVGPERLGEVAKLGALLPGLPIVIDHVGNLRIDGRTPPEEWVRGIEACARQKNVHCKVSGLAEGSGKADGSAPTDVEFYRPVLDVLWREFGPERLVFGSNWPVSARFASFAGVHAIAHQYFASQGNRALELYFRANALRIYGVGSARA